MRVHRRACSLPIVLLLAGFLSAALTGTEPYATAETTQAAQDNAASDGRVNDAHARRDKWLQLSTDDDLVIVDSDEAGAGAIANIAGLNQSPGCSVVGNAGLEFPGNNVLVGTAFSITETVNLFKFGFAMDDITSDPVNVTLYFSIHRRSTGDTGVFSKVYGESFMRTTDTDISLLTTDPFPAPLTLQAGFDYIFTVAWTTPSLTYANDPDQNGSSGQAFPEFPFANYLGVTVQINPQIPTPDEFPLFVGTTQAPFVIELCLTGACCLGDTCEDLGRSECVAQDGDSATPGSTCSDSNVECPFQLAACCNNGFCDVQSEFECAEAGGTWFGNEGPDQVLDCSDVELCIPKGACCLDAGVCADNITEANCLADGGFYNGDDTTCDSLDTGCNRGACCLLTGNCVQRRLGTEEGDCNPLIGHVFNGYGSPCLPETCESRGACCLGDSCVDATPDECSNFGGNYRGDNTDCGTLTIPCGSGACCRADGCDDGTGSGIPEDLCEFELNGSFQGDGSTCSSIDPCPGICCEDDTNACLVTDAISCNAVGTYAGVRDDECNEDTNPCESISEDAVACCLPNGNCVNAYEDTCDELGGYADANGSTCDTATCDAPPTGGCCLPNGACIEVPQANCIHIYRGDGVPCPGPGDPACDRSTCCLATGGDLVIEGIPAGQCVTAEICDDFGGILSEACDGVCETAGACCLPDESCLEVTEDDCLAANGIFRGDDTLCEEVPTCVRGACCDGEVCNEVLGEDCIAKTETYLGDGSVCGADGSACDMGACCQNDESCTIITRGECEVQMGAFAGSDTTCDEGLCDSGACCRADGTCDDGLFSFQCVDTLDVLFPATCAQIATLCEPRGICCANGTCSDLDQDDCILIGGTPGPTGTVCDDFAENPCEIGSCCTGTTCNDDTTRLECDELGGVLRVGVTCETPCPEDGACCMLDGSCIDSNFSSIQCADMEGEWTPESTCEFVGPFCDARGACCLPDDSCQIFSEAVCMIANGEYNGDGVGCNDISCVPPTGACCLPDESCEVQTEADCNNAGGYYNGDDSECEDAECLLGACCDGDTCSQTIAAACTGTYLGAGVACEEDICNSGACCGTDGCTETINGLCDGFFRDGRVCEADTCTIGSCCGLDGTCQDFVFRDECPALTEPAIDPFNEELTCSQVICPQYRVCCYTPEVPPTAGIDLTCETTTLSECTMLDGANGAVGLTCLDDIGGDPCDLGACCLANGTCENNLTRTECFRRGGDFSQDQLCADTTCPLTGACCEPDGSCSESIFEAQCTVNLGGVYAGNGTDCDDTFQVCETASCCEVDGTCSDEVLGAECLTRGGQPIDSAQSCVDEPTCNPRGACCYEDKEMNKLCTLAEASECTDSLEGNFAGIGTLCDDITCTEGGCCFGETCEIRANEAACIEEGGCFSDTETCDMVDCLSVICLSIDDSMPTSGTIDIGQPSDPDGSNPAGLTSVVIVMTADTTFLTESSFSVSSTAGAAPTIAGVTPNGNEIEITFDMPIPAGAWTTITFLGDGSNVCLGYHPANVDGKDAVTNGGDIQALIGGLEGSIVLSLEQMDINRDGEAGPEDILRVIDLLNGAETYDAWFGLSLPPNPCIEE